MRVRTLPSAVFLLVATSLLASCSSKQPPSRGSTDASDNPSQLPATSITLPEVEADPRDPVLARTALTLLSRQHLLHKPVDDAISRDAFDKYLEMLDASKLLLLKPHVDALAVYRDQLDDQLREGDLSLARKGTALLAERRKVVAKAIEELLAQPFDFSVDEQLETDGKKREFVATEDELKQRWRQVLKLQALEQLQQLQDHLDTQAKPDKDKEKAKQDADESKREAAALKAFGDIPADPAQREAKVRSDMAQRFATQFARLTTADKLQPATDQINAINAAFDPHTQYMPPEDEENFGIAMTGVFYGIGATLGEQGHYVIVHDVIPGGASWQQGKLEAGDLIMAVGQDGAALVPVDDMPLDKVVQMIRGPKGTVVVLKIKKADGRIEMLSITRDVVRIEASYARGAMLSSPQDKHSVGYVYLPSFYGEIGGRKSEGDCNATDDVRALLQTLTKRGARSIVLDLRGNGGGLLNHARDISGLFIPSGPVVQTRGSDRMIEVLSDTDPRVHFSGNVVVLVDHFSASAAEILAGALQDYERAVVVGTSATHGKGTVQTVIDLDRLVRAGTDKLGLYKLTVQEYFRVSGASTQLRGVTPDILLADPNAYLESGERTLHRPVPWSTIAKAPFTPWSHSWRLDELKGKSDERTRKEPVFGQVNAYTAALKQRRDQSLQPLQQAAWQAQRARDKAELEKLDPKLKEAPERLQVEVLQGGAGAVSDAKVKAQLEKWRANLARDPWVAECVQVARDMAAVTP